MIGRRRFVEALAGGLLAAPRMATAQPAAKIWRIGALDTGTADAASAARWKAFRERLRELGYAEGKTLTFEARWADGQVGRLPSLAAELVEAKVDILVTAGSTTALAARGATSTLPIVMATGGDPVELGLVSSLARPGGNVTGVISLTHVISGKRVELLKQLTPRTSRVAFLRDPDNRQTAISLRETERVAKAMGLNVQSVPVRGPGDLEPAFAASKRARADAVIFGENTAFIAERQRVADLAIAHRLPMIAPAREYAEAGALVSYGTNYLDLFRRAAGHVDRILRGASPADLPIEQPTQFELVINLKTARALGLTIPQSVALRADEVIR